MWASGVKPSGGGMTLYNRGNVVVPDFDKDDLTIDSDYHDLNLASIVPVGATMVQLQIGLYSSNVGNRVIFREKDYSVNYVSQRVYVMAANIPNDPRVWFGLNADRVMEYAADAVTWSVINITVVAWAL